jgi:DhnA family fructose-bisphosphate aldolase class Ia
MSTVDKRQFKEFVAEFVKTSTGDVLISAILHGLEVSKSPVEEFESTADAVAYTIYNMFKLIVEGNYPNE